MLNSFAGFVKKMTGKKASKKENKKNALSPAIIPRTEHTLSRKNMDRNALKVLYRLHEAGFAAYLVGGCVRDLLLGRQPKDFDIATNARPEEIRRLFRNCRLIGRRFRLAHILFGREVIEVATFRAHHAAIETHDAKTRDGMIIRDNVYGSIEEDVERRDFRINALYYNIADYSIVDYTHGMADIKNKTLHVIGDPVKRFHEDPVRLLRAVRFLAKLNLQMTPETEEPLKSLTHLLQNVSPARLFQEVLKIVESGSILATMELLQKYQLFSPLFVESHSPSTNNSTALFQLGFTDADKRIHQKKNISPAFIFSIILWRPIAEKMQKGIHKGIEPLIALEYAIDEVIKKQKERLTIPRVMQSTIHDICLMQQQLEAAAYSVEAYDLLDHPRFRAAYDLLLLRAASGEMIKKSADFWEQFYAASPEKRQMLIKNKIKQTPNAGYAKNKRRRRRTIKKISSPVSDSLSSTAM